MVYMAPDGRWYFVDDMELICGPFNTREDAEKAATEDWERNNDVPFVDDLEEDLG